MSKIAVTTDTNSGISCEDAEKYGVYSLAMPFTIDGEEYFEGVNCTYEQFFEKLAQGADVKTSQPSIYSLKEFWDEILKTHDCIVHIPMSSALSSSCSSAKALSADYDGKVFVADNKRISISQREAVLDAKKMVEKGMSAKEICDKLEADAYKSSIYLAVNRLDLLKKSGRVTKAAAAVATVLNLKPVLQIQGGKLDAFAKSRGMINAEKVMLEAMQNDLNTRFLGKKISLHAAYSGKREDALDWYGKVKKAFPQCDVELFALPISICCHVADGVHALGCFENVE